MEMSIESFITQIFLIKKKLKRKEKKITLKFELKRKKKKYKIVGFHIKLKRKRYKKKKKVMDFILNFHITNKKNYFVMSKSRKTKKNPPNSS